MSNKISADLPLKEIITDRGLERVNDYCGRIVETMPEHRESCADAIHHLSVHKSFKFHLEKPTMTMLSDIMFDRCPSMKVDWVAHRGKMYTIEQIVKQKGDDKIILRVKNDQDELAFTLFDEVIDYTTSAKHPREMLDVEVVGVDYPVSLIIDRTNS